MDNSDIDDNIVIIARYNENVSWVLKLLKNKWINKVLIVNKGPQLDLKHEKILIMNAYNVGREGETYLSYIIKNYDKLPKHIFFSQGDPFVHCASFLNFFTYENFNLYKNNKFYGMTENFKLNVPINYILNNTFYQNNMKRVEYLVDVKTLQIVGHNMFKDKGVKNFNTEHINILWKKMNIKNKYIKFCFSACFYTTRESITSRNLEFYKELLNFIFSESTDGGLQGYVLERYWSYIFDPIGYESLNEYYKDLIKSKFIGLFDNKRKNLIIIINSRHNNILVVNSSFILHDKNKVLPCLTVDIKHLRKNFLKISCQNLNIAKQKYLQFINRN